uniref:ATP synthase subunit a n=1 Tax=Orthogonalys pulchella TaxID=32427 RepID=A0A096XMY4_9HYME|nr:ATP synthase F0 subunit 6 [Orthogonalys pulchella]AIC37437.1 ATP synthase F0 subunit 6 [Orthogonalys pulchella]
MFPNLFSIFDPSTSFFFSLNWFSYMIFIIFLPPLYWMKSSRLIILIYEFIMFLYNEFKLMLNKTMMSNLILMLSLMYMIIINNLLGLFPYIFVSTSHLVLTVSFSLTFWLSFNIYGWFNNFYLMFYHLVPVGTPLFLMPFMVLIETISNLIRPLTLSVRLMANMIAGHLLITLLSSLGFKVGMVSLILVLLVQFILFLLELGVSFIQGYVFVVLMIMYSKEVDD